MSPRETDSLLPRFESRGSYESMGSNGEVRDDSSSIHDLSLYEPTPFDKVKKVMSILFAPLIIYYNLWYKLEAGLLALNTRPTSVLAKTLFCSPATLALPVVPAGLLRCYLSNPSDLEKFILMFVGIVPLAAILSYATEQLAGRIGNGPGALLNATFGNAVEIVVSIQALRNGQIEVVQQSMMGSILSNLLLVLGFCLFISGLTQHANFGRGQTTFDADAAGHQALALFFACISLIIPSILSFSMSGAKAVIGEALIKSDEARLLTFSRAGSILLVILYVAFLVFSLYTHDYMFKGGESDEDEEEEEEELFLSIPEAIFILIAATGIISIAADFLVESIDGVVATGLVSKTFIGLILIPIVGNAAEHASACLVAKKGKMDLAINISLGSGIQIALFATPICVFFGFFFGQPMTLQFQFLGTVVLLLGVIAVNWMLQDGKSNYFEGLLCIGIYIFIGLAAWVSPDPPSVTHAIQAAASVVVQN